LWRTETEVNNYGFEVERKNPPINPLQEGEFEKIGFIDGHGNSNSPKSYEFVDKNARYGKHYYRLRQIDVKYLEYSTILLNLEKYMILISMVHC